MIARDMARGWLIVFLLSCASAPAVPRPAAQAAPAPAAMRVARAPAKVRSVEGITEYRLDNGLVILLCPDATQSTVTVNVTYLVGSRVEGYGETGMAHLLEHLQFKGTAQLDDIGKLLDARGAQSNASTWTDRTNYYETLAATGDNLDWALAMEADRMIHSRIADADLASELTVVRNELERDDSDPHGLLGERIASAAYVWHSYGKATIGARADIEHVPATSLRRFYQRYYQPDNAVLVVAGKYDEAAALATIARTFGAIPRPARALEPTYTVEPVQDGERTVTLRRNGDLAVIGIAYHTVGGASPDYPAVQAALSVLTRESTGRLYTKLVEPGLAGAVAGEQLAFRDPYLAEITAEVSDPKQLDAVERAMLAEIEGLGGKPITDREVERWRAGARKELDKKLADSQGLALELSEVAALGDWRTLFAYRDRIEQITAADVQRVARAFFKPSNRTVGRFIPTADPDRAPEVATPDAAAIVAKIDGGEVKEPGEVFAATLANLEARTVRRTLAGGIRAALLARQTRGATVQLHLSLRYGDATSLRGKAEVAEVTARLLARGTRTRSYIDVRDQLDLLRSELAIDAAPGELSVQLQSTRDQLAGAIDLVAELLTRPALTADQLAQVKRARRAELMQLRQDPPTVAYQALQAIAAPWPHADPRARWTIDDQLAALDRVTLADVRAFHRDFLGAGHAELAVVGAFAPDAVASQIERTLGGWRARLPYTRLDHKPFGAPAVSRSIEIKDKEMAQLMLFHDVAMRDTDPDYPAWLILGQLLGGDTGARLWTRIREREGLSYDVLAYTDAGALDDAGGFGAAAIVAPANLARVRASLLDEIARLAIAPAITADELTRARDGWLRQQDTALSRDDYVVGLLADQLELGRTTAEAVALRAAVAKLTIADLERVARKYVQPDRLISVDAGTH
jgi:zinc protease